MHSTVIPSTGNEKSTEAELVDIDLICKDQETQLRAQFSQQALDEYKAHLESGGKLPPIVLFLDEAAGKYYVGDGWHRLLSYDEVGDKVPAIVRLGTHRDALRWALSANQAHGVQRTNADKRRVVQVALADSEWGQISSRQLGAVCGVHHSTVTRIREERTPDHELSQSDSSTGEPEVEKLKGKDGKLRPARKKSAATKPAPAEDVDPATEFDPKNLPARKKPGREVITPKQRKDGRAAMGKLVRAIDVLGGDELCGEHLDAIAEKMRPIWGGSGGRQSNPQRPRIEQTQHTL